MEFTEIKKDLFTMDDAYCLAHCISSDAKMGAGIAVEFKKGSSLPLFKRWPSKAR